MTDATITLRKATPKDAADLLIIDNMASHGMSLAFWQDAVAKGEGEDPLSLARERFANEKFIFGCANAHVAELDGRIAGAVTGYEMPEPDEDAEAIKREFPGFKPVFVLFEQAVGDWFVDSMAVYPEFRGRGIAAQLLDQCLENGRRKGLKKVSLVVEDGNKSALRIYEKSGFAVQNSLPYVQGETRSDSENWLLLSREL